jgi:hypothetical protein
VVLEAERRKSHLVCALPPAAAPLHPPFSRWVAVVELATSEGSLGLSRWHPSVPLVPRGKATKVERVGCWKGLELRYSCPNLPPLPTPLRIEPHDG